jgi:hypothetical protein
MGRVTADAKVASDVERFGWHCLHVAPSEGEEGAHFTYTIGLSKTLGHPDLAIFGLKRETAHAILSDCVQDIRSGTTFPIDTPVSNVVQGDWLMQFRRVREECLAEWFGTAKRYYNRHPFQVLIMFWQNKDRQFPWESSDPSVQEEAMHVV